MIVCGWPQDSRGCFGPYFENGPPALHPGAGRRIELIDLPPDDLLHAPETEGKVLCVRGQGRTPGRSRTYSTKGNLIRPLREIRGPAGRTLDRVE